MTERNPPMADTSALEAKLDEGLHRVEDQVKHVDEVVSGLATQVVHPWKASLRTAVQTVVPLILALALAAPAIVNELPDQYVPEGIYVWLGTAAAAAAAFAGALARISAIPAVNDFLDRLGLGTGVKPPTH